MATPIANMIAEMHAKGIPVEFIVRAVETLEEAMAARAVSTGQIGSKVDTSTIDRRRAWDRERKRKQRTLRLPDSKWWALIGEIVHRDGSKCTYCGSTKNLTADHVVPMTRGGTHDPSNLTACCIPCNTAKGNRLLAEWPPGQSAVFHPTVHRNPAENPCIIREKKEEAIRVEVKEKKESKRVARGTRIPADFQINDDDRKFALSLGLPPDRIEEETPQFIDYWSSVSGANGVKLDWKATWRNRMRDLKRYKGNSNGNRTANSRTTGHDAILAAATRAAGKIPRDDELAGTSAAAQFPFGDGVDANRDPMDRRAHGRSEGFDNGREPAAGRVFEGEIIAPDKVAAGLSNGWRRH